MKYFHQPVHARPGYAFDGWFVDEARTLRLNPGANLPHSITIYDHWVLVEYPVTYHLPYGLNNRRNPKTITVESGIKKLFPPIQSEKFFDGWYWKGKRVDYLPEGLHEPIELTARFSDVPVVFFETGLGARVDPKLVSHQGKLAPFRPPLRPGYTFEGWYEDPNYQQEFSFQSLIRQNKVLYAKWKEQHFEIVYELEGGYFEKEPLRSFSYDSPTIWLMEPKRKGYRFMGWKDRWNQDVTIIPSHTSVKRVLKATWQKNDPEVHTMVRKTTHKPPC